MREFLDDTGARWVASFLEREGEDYKGRYCLRFVPDGGAEGRSVTVEDVRWNSPKTAERTLETMSDMELRRRLKIGRGRVA
jgi:hypothetical protein